MKRILLACVPALLLAAACASTESSTESLTGDGAAWRGSIDHWGTLREALRDGRDEGRVAVASVASENVYALGALEGLEGEVTIVDGNVWISRGSPERTVTVREASSEQATVMAAASVGAWEELAVEEDVDPSVLDAYVARRAREVGLDTSRPFPFVVEGGLVHLQAHVIGGECPMRARMLGKTMTKPPFSMHADAVDGKLVGIYAEDAAGTLTHMGASSHVHAVLEGDETLTCHVETVGLTTGAKLFLPRG